MESVRKDLQYLRKNDSSAHIRFCLSDHSLNSSSSVSASESSTSAFLGIISINRYQVADQLLDTIAVRAPFGAKKGLTVKGKTTESEIVFTSWEKSIPSRNFAEILVFRRASVSSTYPYQSVRPSVGDTFKTDGVKRNP